MTFIKEIIPDTEKEQIYYRHMNKLHERYSKNSKYELFSLHSWVVDNDNDSYLIALRGHGPAPEFEYFFYSRGVSIFFVATKVLDQVKKIVYQYINSKQYYILEDPIGYGSSKEKKNEIDSLLKESLKVMTFLYSDFEKVVVI